MKRLLYLLPLLTLVFACASRDKDLPEGIEVVPVEREDAAEDASDFLEKIEIVPLETNDSSLIPRPGKMLYSKEMDMYATRTKGIVYTFTGDGRYIGNSKRRMGQGPEDYVMALYMQFNPYLKGIDLLNPYGTVYTYSPTFDLIAKRKCEPEFPLSGFMPIDSVNYMLTYVDMWAGEEMLFENIRTHQKSGATYQGTISARNNLSTQDYFYRQGEQFYFVPHGINYYLYKVDMEKKQLTPAVYLDFGDEEVKEEGLPGYGIGQRTDDEDLRRKISEGMVERYKYIKNTHKTTPGLKLFNEDFIYVFFYTHEQGVDGSYIYNRKTKKGFLLKNGKPFDMYYCFDLVDNVLLAVCQPEEGLSRFVDRSLMSPEEIHEMEQLKEDDNPVIIKYYLKR